MKKILGLFFLLNSFCFFGQVNLDSGLVACYALNGNGYEAIHGFHGILNNITPAADRFNSLNKSLSFNASAGSNTELASNSLFKTAAVSFSGWIKPFNGPSGYIVYTMNSFGSQAYSLYLANNMLNAKKCNNSFTATLTGTTSLASNTWYHVCFTMDHDYLKIYLNGLLEDSVHASMNFNYGAGQNIYIGSGFTGSIDNVRFYNRIITAAEVVQLYNSDPACIATTAPPVVSFSTSPLCVGKAIKFTDLSTNNPSYWHWQIPGGVTSTSLTFYSHVSVEFSPQYTFNTTGSYAGTLTTSNASGSSTYTFSVIVNPNPTISVVASPTFICRYDSSTLTATGALTYSWPGGQTGGSSAVLSPFATTNYSVTGFDTNGCAGTNTVWVKVSVCHYGSIHENEDENLEITLSPNPTTGMFFLDIVKGEIESYEVINLLGASIIQGKMGPLEKNAVDLASYPNGIYFLKIKNGRMLKTIKIVKE